MVRDLDLVGVTVEPFETDPPLIVDPDGVLPFSITLELSSRFPGGDLRSWIVLALFSMRSFRRATA